MNIHKKHREFLSYLFTLQFLQMRFRDFEKSENYVFIPSNTLRTYFFQNPQAELAFLREQGHILSKAYNTKMGYDILKHRTTQIHPLNFANFKYDGAALDEVTLKMRSYLRHLSIPDNIETNLYFEKFLEVKGHHPACFFKVDKFSGRVHTPVTNLKGELRKQLLIKGESTVFFDVATMQPLLLGKILEDEIGSNEFSDWINSGIDIYLKIQEILKLPSRDASKEKFFEILYGKSNERLAHIFGHTNWIEWVNDIKSRPVAENPNTEEKEHSNLAWLLQTSEVKVMRKIWKQLIAADIIFFSVHDEIIVRQSDSEESQRIIEKVLSGEFKYFRLNGMQRNNCL